MTDNTTPTSTHDSIHNPILSLQDVSYSYTPKSKKVLKDVSMNFESGKCYAIVGPSGVGKTTLLSLISGLALPTSGTVSFNGTNLKNMNRYDYRSHDIGVVFQSFNLLPGMSVEENILLTMDLSGKTFPKPKKEIAADLLKEVHLPIEYAHERILHLSGGEQQRVAIARALSDDPGVIIADEPTGNLDPATEQDIMQIFLNLAHQQNRCVIIVTHNPRVAAQCDKVIELGKLNNTTPRS